MGSVVREAWGEGLRGHHEVLWSAQEHVLLPVTHPTEFVETFLHACIMEVGSDLLFCLIQGVLVFGLYITERRRDRPVGFFQGPRRRRGSVFGCMWAESQKLGVGHERTQYH